MTTLNVLFDINAFILTVEVIRHFYDLLFTQSFYSPSDSEYFKDDVHFSIAIEKRTAIEYFSNATAQTPHIH
jgi:hypothetical protein